MATITVLLTLLIGALGGDRTARMSEGPITLTRAAYTGAVTGVITDAATGQTLQSAQIFLPELNMGGLSNQQGRFLLLNVPAGEHRLRVELIGYESHEQKVTVTDGGTATVNLAMNSVALQMQELVVTGVAGETPRVKLPFTVERVDFATMPRGAGNAGTLVKGKIPSAPIGPTAEEFERMRQDPIRAAQSIRAAQEADRRQRAEEAARILLRGPTTLSDSKPPLIVVDGVATDLTLKEIDPLNVEAIQVLKGRDAIGTYGEPAENGVIIITTTANPQPEEPVGDTYEPIIENPWQSPDSDPLSTFSIDVDRASYANVRRFLNEGRLPPADAVRIEEMINYFSYDYPEARGTDPFSVVAEAGPAPWRPEHQLVRIGIQGEHVDLDGLPPNNLVFLIDVSGSMRGPDKLPLLKDALGLLVAQMRPQDHVAIVVYAGAAGLVLEPTPGSRKADIMEALERLQAGGSTAGGAGLRLAYSVAQKHFVEGGNNRIILATDGDFNVGESGDDAMVALVEEERTGGTFLTVLGFGRGNLRDAKMEKLADHGNGNFSYIDSRKEARKVLVNELGGTLVTIAKDVKVQVEFNPTRVRAYRLIGYENRMLAAEDFDDDTKDAGELGAGHSVTALYEVVPVGSESEVNVSETPELRYRRDEVPALDAAAAGDELMFVKLRYKQPDGDESSLIERPVRHRRGTLSEDFRFAAAVASFGMLLRGSAYAGDGSFERALALAQGSLGSDSGGYRAEFAELVGKAIAIRGETTLVAQRR